MTCDLYQLQQECGEILSDIKNQLGMNAIAKEQYTEALQYLTDSLKWIIEHLKESQYQMLGKLCLNLGKCLQHSNQETAKDYITKSIQLSTKVRERYYLIILGKG